MRALLLVLLLAGCGGGGDDGEIPPVTPPARPSEKICQWSYTPAIQGYRLLTGEAMARKPQLEPAWLVSLLNAWALRSQRESSRALGWYSMCPMLQSGIPGRARSYEPTGFSGQDYSDLLVALQELEVVNRMAVGRYFKPWARDAIDAEFQASDDTWLRRLRAALDQLDRKLRLPVAEQQDCG